MASGSKLPGFSSFDKMPSSQGLGLLSCEGGFSQQIILSTFWRLGAAEAACHGPSGVSDTSVVTVASVSGVSDKAKGEACWPWEPALALLRASHGTKPL